MTTPRRDQSAEIAARQKATYSTQTFVCDDRSFTLIREASAMMATQAEIAAMLGISIDALKSARKKYPEIDETIEVGQGAGKMSLRRKQFRLAEKSAGMAIFLGKNYLGQRDVQDVRHGGDEANPVLVQMDYAKLSVEDLRDLERLALKAQPANDTDAGPERDQEGDGRSLAG
jgi:DNA-binding CsgD family transcriptional regulator